MGKYSARVVDHLILPALAGLPVGLERDLRRSGRRIPAPVAVRLLIDTGSKRSTLVPGVLDHLEAPAGEPVRVATSLRAGVTQFFWVRLSFPEAGLAPFEMVQVALLGMPVELASFHGVLGRDLLRELVSFDYEGRGGRYTLRDTAGPFGWLRRLL
jgi:hypothetical protein